MLYRKLWLFLNKGVNMRFSEYIMSYLNETEEKHIVLDDPILLADLKKLIEDKTIWMIKDTAKNAYTFKYYSGYLNIITKFAEKYDSEPVKKGDRIWFYIDTPEYKVRLQSSGKKHGGPTKGHTFEDELTQRITDSKGVNVNDIKDDLVKRIMLEAGISVITKPAIKRGAENSKRKIILYKPPTEKNIGDILSDIDIYGLDKSGKEVKKNLSLKYGSMISYINRGIADYIATSDYKTRKLSKPAGQKLFEVLGLDTPELTHLYFDIFAKYNDYKNNNASKTQIIEIKKFDKKGIFNIVQNAIGTGYIKIHQIGASYDIETIDDRYLAQYKNPTAIYAKFTYGAKRVDLSIEFGNKRLKVVLRNKQGGLYPSHIFVDACKDGFKFKPGKEI